MWRSRGVVGVLIGLVILAAGCGDGDDQSVLAVVDDDPTPVATLVVAPTLAPTRLATVTPRRTASPDDPATATATPTPTITASPVDAVRFLAVYDADPAGPDDYDDWIGVVSQDDELIRLGVYFDGHTVIGGSGVPTAHGTIVLEGGGTLEDDIVVSLEGAATFSETPSRQRVDGELHDSFTQSSFQSRFRFERAAAATSARFAGTYRVGFDPSPSGCECLTVATITLEVDDDGLGRSIATAVERDTSGVEIGTFGTGACLVTPSGRVRCQLGYETLLPGQFGRQDFLVTLTGSLDGKGGRGVSSGVIFPSATMLDGAWTAVRE